VPLSTQCINPWPVKFINHHPIGLNSGVNWGSWNQLDTTVGKSVPVTVC